MRSVIVRKYYVPVQVDVDYSSHQISSMELPREVTVEINNLYPEPCLDIGGVTYTNAFLKECTEPLIVRASDGSLAELSFDNRGLTAKAHRVERTVLPPQQPLRTRRWIGAPSDGR